MTSPKPHKSVSFEHWVQPFLNIKDYYKEEKPKYKIYKGYSNRTAMKYHQGNLHFFSIQKGGGAKHTIHITYGKKYGFQIKSR